MLALKALLIVAGVLFLAAAVGIPLYGLWIRLRFARRQAAGEPELPQTELTQTEPAHAQLIQPQGIDWRRPAALDRKSVV